MKIAGALFIAFASFTIGSCGRDLKDGYTIFERDGYTYIKNTYSQEIQPVIGMRIGNETYTVEQIRKSISEDVNGVDAALYKDIQELELLARKSYLKQIPTAAGFADPRGLSYSFRETATGVEPYVVSGNRECALRSVGGLPQLGSLDYRIDGIKQEISENLQTRVKNTFQDISKAFEYGSDKAFDGLDKLKRLTEEK